MNGNKKQFVGVTNFEYIIENYIIHDEYISNPFVIQDIPNVNWFIKVQYNNASVMFQLYNQYGSLHSFQNQVKIEILVGIVPNIKKFCTVTETVYEYQNLIDPHELRNLCTPHLYGQTYVFRSQGTLHVNIKIEPICISEKKSTDISSLTSCNNFEQFLTSDILSDFVFQINNEKFPAHKVVLASVSPVFKQMFSHQMTENITNEVQINDTDPDVFKEMLRYIYSGKIENLDIMAFNLCVLANKYDIPMLQRICLQYLEEYLANDNVISILKLADHCNSVDLKNKCFEYIDKNFAEVKETKPFKDLEKELLMEFICTIKAKK